MEPLFLVQPHPSPPLLDRTALFLGLEPLALGGAAGAGADALGLADMGPGDQLGKAGAGFLAIGFLGAVLAGGDDDLAAARHPAAGELLEAREDVRRET